MTMLESALRAGSRPPLELMPTKIAELIVERDRIAVQRQAAEIKVRELAEAHLDVAAKQADDEAASSAARSGKTIPKTSRTQKLADDREQAARERAAQESALYIVTNELSTAMGEAYPWDTIAATRAQTRAKLEAAANELADLVETEVKADAAVEWLRSEAFSHNAPSVRPQDVVNLSNLNTNDLNTTDRLRDVIVKTATAPFATEEIR